MQGDSQDEAAARSLIARLLHKALRAQRVPMRAHTCSDGRVSLDKPGARLGLLLETKKKKTNAELHWLQRVCRAQQLNKTCCADTRRCSSVRREALASSASFIRGDGHRNALNPALFIIPRAYRRRIAAFFKSRFKHSIKKKKPPLCRDLLFWTCKERKEE